MKIDFEKNKNVKIIVSIVSICIVITLIYSGYHYYQKKNESERRQTEISMLKMISESYMDSKNDAQKAKDFYAERRKRIEAGTAKIETINKTSYGSKYQYTLMDGKKEGPSYSWYSSGRKEYERFFRDDFLEGEEIKYYDNNANSIKSKKNYIKGKISGDFREWFEDGSPKTIGFSSLDDPKLSYQKTWYKNGQLKVDSYFDEKEQLEIFLLFHENGQMQMIYRKNVRGRPEGMSEMWYESGQKEQEKLYRNGRVIYSKEWNEKGELIRQYPDVNK